MHDYPSRIVLTLVARDPAAHEQHVACASSSARADARAASARWRGAGPPCRDAVCCAARASRSPPPPGAGSSAARMPRRALGGAPARARALHAGLHHPAGGGARARRSPLPPAPAAAGSAAARGCRPRARRALGARCGARRTGAVVVVPSGRPDAPAAGRAGRPCASRCACPEDPQVTYGEPAHRGSGGSPGRPGGAVTVRRDGDSMVKFFARRLIALVAVVVMVTVVTWICIHGLRPEAFAYDQRSTLGQLWDYLTSAFLHFELGNSWENNQPPRGGDAARGPARGPVAARRRDGVRAAVRALARAPTSARGRARRWRGPPSPSR